MIIFGNQEKIYLPYSDNGLIEVEYPILKDYSINVNRGLIDWGRGYNKVNCGLMSTELELSFVARNVNIVENHNNLFKQLTDNLSIKELMEIVQNKLRERKTNRYI